MLKWSRYASNILDVHMNTVGEPLEFTQALLQHYGWRSFFVDCSASAAVSAWFASHVYSDKRKIEFCEDCEERPIWLIKRMAAYEFAEGDGNLYAFDKALVEERIGATDLAALKVDAARPRMEAQSAWLLGPLRNTEVPPECFVAHIKASRTVFRDYAAEEGFVETNHLFPPTHEDPVLRTLLGIPWKKVELPDNGREIPVFHRALDLPEYHDSFRTIASPATAFFQGARVADRGSIDGEMYGGVTVRVPEIVLFGTADEAPLRFPKVGNLLTSHRSVAFEVDDLIQHVNMQGAALYQKGIVVTAHEPNLVELCELWVEHPGLEMTRAGMTKGWFYRVGEDGIWAREVTSEQCNCGNDSVHLRHISALRIVEAYLTEPSEFSERE